ncbi:YkgJ family cysteine cluster protein [Chitinolyticbacter albus]|uniref:YkgJ family cysteine cluster protein n=1 Tax=Chitinolyticbacter albus TaxID=2961951 RepID=UPI00210F12EA|nr:YkgJ family cysteine cluster protein [Chitinolyticbacter albus]
MPAPARKLIHLSVLDDLSTWVRYRSSLCRDCQATCCTMPVEVKLPDLVRMGVVDAFEAEHEAPKQIAKRLDKAGIIGHFNFKHGIYTLAQRANGDCRYLDAQSRRCTIYEQRPNTCRNHPQVGPRPGHCAYRHR